MRCFKFDVKNGRSLAFAPPSNRFNLKSVLYTLFMHSCTYIVMKVVMTRVMTGHEQIGENIKTKDTDELME